MNEMTKEEALSEMKDIADKNGIFLTVTETEQGECIAVSWQDDEHRMLQVLWRKE
jgi:hypothetical protein